MRIAKRISVVLIALVLCGAVATGFALWRDGYRAYVVHTGSMMPTYNPGDVVIDKPATHLVPGQVITFRHSAFTDDVVTHRIRWVKNGVIRTKGDANPTPDAWFIRTNQVQGTVTTSVPKLGYLLVFLQQRTGVAAVVTGFLAIVLLWGLFFPAAASEVSPAAILKTARPATDRAHEAAGRVLQLDDAATFVEPSAIERLRSNRVVHSL